jgi:hypothetical protein
MNDSASRTAWLIDPRHFTFGNLLIDASQATLASIQQVCDNIQDYLSTLTVSPDPTKQPIGAQYLVSYHSFTEPRFRTPYCTPSRLTYVD